MARWFGRPRQQNVSFERSQHNVSALRSQQDVSALESHQDVSALRSPQDVSALRVCNGTSHHDSRCFGFANLADLALASPGALLLAGHSLFLAYLLLDHFVV